MSLTYARRKNVTEKIERQYRIEPDALVEVAKGREARFPWKDVAAIRLSYTATGAGMVRHVTILKLKDGRKVEFDNIHFKGMGSFESRAATYSPFVREVVARVKRNAPGAEAREGATPLGYFALLALAGFMAIVAVLVLILTFSGEELTFSAWVRIGSLVVLAPIMFVWIRKAKPKGGKQVDLSNASLP